MPIEAQNEQRIKHLQHALNSLDHKDRHSTEDERSIRAMRDEIRALRGHARDGQGTTPLPVVENKREFECVCVQNGVFLCGGPIKDVISEALRRR